LVRFRNLVSQPVHQPVEPLPNRSFDKPVSQPGKDKGEAIGLHPFTKTIMQQPSNPGQWQTVINIVKHKVVIEIKTI
jgi:hypothetical protein